MADIKKNLKQRDLEAFEEHFNAIDPELKGQARNNGAVVRAAVAAGWLNGTTDEAVGEMTAKEVRQLAQQVSTVYTELIALDPL